jgi:hypothetical protein
VHVIPIRRLTMFGPPGAVLRIERGGSFVSGWIEQIGGVVWPEHHDPAAELIVADQFDHRIGQRLEGTGLGAAARALGSIAASAPVRGR